MKYYPFDNQKDFDDFMYAIKSGNEKLFNAAIAMAGGKIKSKSVNFLESKKDVTIMLPCGNVKTLSSIEVSEHRPKFIKGINYVEEN